MLEWRVGPDRFPIQQALKPELQSGHRLIAEKEVVNKFVHRGVFVFARLLGPEGEQCEREQSPRNERPVEQILRKQ